MSPKIVFMGTPDFAVPALEALHAAFGVNTVVTIPDKKKGRGQTMQESAVKSCATSLGITHILTPESLKAEEFMAEIAAIAPDVICVIAFRILPRTIYSLAKLGSFNVHASLLPKYRGAAPINHALLNGDRVTGVTSFILNDQVDTGNIIEQRSFEIPEFCTAGELYNLLKPLAASCAVSTAGSLLSNSAVIQPQNDAMASPAPKVFRENCGIDTTQPARSVMNFIHAMSPSPCAWLPLNDDVVKVYSCRPSDDNCPPGTFRFTDSAFQIGCADSTLDLTVIQFPGKPRVMVSDFIRGYRGIREGALQ